MTKKSKKKMSNGVKVGLIAIAINIITVMVYLYQSNLMRKQQHASVWPHMEWRAVYNQEKGFSLTASNKGIGPALIRNVTFKLNDEIQPNLDSIYSKVLGRKRFPHVSTPIRNRVVSADESINLIKVTDHMWAELLNAKLRENKFEMEICYESIYEDSWVSSGIEVVRSRCD